MHTLSVDGAVSRRRVLQTVAWTAPAVVVATAVPATAASQTQAANPLATSYISNVVHSGNQDIVTAQVTIPSNVSLTAVSVVVYWDSNGANSSVALSMPGATWSPATLNTEPASFTTGATLTGSKVLTVTITKGARQTGSDFTIVITGTPAGSSSAAQVTLPGEYP